MENLSWIGAEVVLLCDALQPITKQAASKTAIIIVRFSAVLIKSKLIVLSCKHVCRQNELWLNYFGNKCQLSYAVMTIDIVNTIDFFTLFHIVFKLS